MERKEAIKYVKTYLLNEKYNIEALTTLIPELQESEDERVRKSAIAFVKASDHFGYHLGISKENVLSWLEKQGEPIDKEKVKIGARKDLALSIINYLDNNRVAGCMCLSSMECEDIEDACVNSKWTKLYNYMKKKLEKQSERESTNKATWSKEDERLCQCLIKDRKEALDNVRNSKYGHSEIISDLKEMYRERISWLKSIKDRIGSGLICTVKDEESDDEQEPTDNTKSDFNVGDWVVQRDGDCFVSGNTFAQITNIDDEGLCWLDCRTWITGREIRLWTIHDAKDGDVLVSPRQKGCEADEDIFIFKRIGNRDYVDNCIEYYCDVCDGEFYVNKICYMGTTSSPLYPATEKQRDMLFAKMKKAGYKWDDEKKQILRIDNSKNTIEK